MRTGLPALPQRAASRGLGRVGPKPGAISGPHVAPGRRAKSRRRTSGTGASRPEHCLRGGDVADEAASEAARSRGTATGSLRQVRRRRRRCQLRQNGCHQPTSGCGAKEQRGEYCEHYAAARVLGRTASPSRRRFIEYEGRGVHERRFLQHVCASLRPACLRRPNRPLPATRFLGLWPTCDRSPRAASAQRGPGSAVLASYLYLRGFRARKYTTTLSAIKLIFSHSFTQHARLTRYCSRPHQPHTGRHRDRYGGR